MVIFMRHLEEICNQFQQLFDENWDYFIESLDEISNLFLQMFDEKVLFK